MVECPKVLGRPPRVRAPVPLVAKEHQVRAEPSWKKLLKMFKGNVVLLFLKKRPPSPTQSCQVHVRHGAAQEGRRGGRGLRTVRPWEKGNCCLYILIKNFGPVPLWLRWGDGEERLDAVVVEPHGHAGPAKDISIREITF